MRSAVIFGCQGTVLTEAEKSFFKEVQPFGFILFARNIETEEQVKALCDSMREITGDQDTPILIDQEGGRVRRMRPPVWADSFAMAPFGQLYQTDKAQAIELLELQCDLQSSQLLSAGVNVTCAPVLDILFPETHDVIGDRAFGEVADIVGEMGKIVSDRFIKNGVLPIIKHIPGHGRATADSHLELPVVSASRTDLEEMDFKPFRHVKDAPMAMTAHILYEALDPDNCATMSSYVVEEVIRKEIGFKGLLMSDDLSMKALSGSFADKTKACLGAGCDLILHCNGDMEEMLDISKALKPLSETAAASWKEVKSMLVSDFEPMSRYEQETASEKLCAILM